ncbi:uncharacterized protein A4U43_C08F10860 [Asparagus officinalis]|uniref:transcription termination factor MTERF9, chloroplastic n=1 Tax=Asparagus officinalis TaxID=4686 RepID=UPI00098E6707|nr:transcription termination factor MTERF9, chloroplastic [Asparagus officinalis]XP_020241705.1 transcription termination factor MTERF9, chloroplastic [Asparagus officinalis]XP_020241706.1 transcription termination factor MTERF9, chloroplastic [Asparagus officinalis]XP_020241707.1 transcription termination factor MTERF9, chloroplastic [Asparagus officinalis]ONK59802.1 uncharacterized protein A4U43_C08F10860 [Asparagus officinalis]
MLCLSLNPRIPFLSPPHPLSLSPHSVASLRRRSCAGVFSSHSNPRILKSNRRNRRTSAYYEDDEDDESESELSDDDSSDLEEAYGNRPSVSLTSTCKVRKARPTKTGSRLKLALGSPAADSDSDNQSKNGKFTEIQFQKLAEELDFDEKWYPLIKYLNTFGLNESHFISIYERHMPSLQINLASAQERLEFLLSVGVKHRDIKRILVRQPQILEYTVENNMMSHVIFLLGIGIPEARIGQIITAAPSLFSYSVEHSLKPTIRYLVEEVGIKGSDVSKVVQLSPQILVQRIDNSWTSRLSFLSKELGAPRENIVKMVTKHPQLLHYSIEDGILPRINFLRSIGMRNSEILKVLTSLTQVLSLSLERNLRPKYLYLVNELRNEVQSLTKYPMYLSLSLDQRIRPRHRFLVSLKKAPKGPFPLSSFVPTDESFCQQWAGTSLDKYLAFRQRLLLTDFAKKYEKKGY